MVSQLGLSAVSVLASLISDISFSRDTIIKGLVKLGDGIGAYSVGSTNEPGTVIPQRVTPFRKLKASCTIGAYILANIFAVSFSVLGGKIALSIACF